METIDLKTYTTADLIEAFVILKNQADALDAEIKTKKKQLELGIEKIQTEVKERMVADSVANLTVDGFGTAFFTPIKKVSISNWREFVAHAEEQLAKGVPLDTVLGAFHKKLSTEYVDKYIEENGREPKGVTIFSERALQIRRI